MKGNEEDPDEMTRRTLTYQPYVLCVERDDNRKVVRRPAFASSTISLVWGVCSYVRDGEEMGPS